MKFWVLLPTLVVLSTPTGAVTCTSTAAGGDWNAAGTWAADCGGGTPGAADTAIIATTGAGVVTLTTTETVANLTLNHDVATNVALNFTGGSLTVSTLLTLTNGVVTTGTFNLTVSADCTTSVSRTAGWIDGNLRLTFVTGSVTCAFPLGDSSSYVPVSIAKTGTNTGTLNGTAVSGDFTYVTKGFSGIDPSKSVNFTWTFTPISLGANTPYGATFTYSAADTDAAATVGSLILRKKALDTHATAVGPWISPTITGTPTATTLVANGLRTFGIFAIGVSQTTANKSPYAHFRERF